MLLGKDNLFFCFPDTSGWSVSKIIITILSFRVGTSENKKIWIIDVIYESDHISLLNDSTMLSAPNIFYLTILL